MSSSFETLAVRQEGAVLFANISAPPMNPLGPELDALPFPNPPEPRRWRARRFSLASPRRHGAGSSRR
jgi:hypothetical protein